VLQLSKVSGSGSGSGSVPKRKLAPNYSPKSENQRDYVQALEDKETPLVFVLGPAGTGKTLFACLTAIQGLQSGAFDRIVLTRPLVTVEEELGFLPGNIKSKMDPWTRPIFDIFLEYYAQKDIDAMLNSGMIEISPLAFMRGRTFKRCFILADEMQNSSPNQMLMAATRIGHGSKMVVNGDLNQSDRGSENGLAVMVRKVRGAMENKHTNVSGIAICDMASEDIERSAIVSTILKIMTPPSVQDLRKQKNDTNISTKTRDLGRDAALIPFKDICQL
jgi:phosphate starvation-inducible PhoH-like protein